MTRIADDMSLLQVCAKLGSGDPEVLRICLDVGKRAGVINPYLPSPWIPVIQLDELGIYDSRIKEFYHDFCGGSMVNFLAVMFGLEQGQIESHVLLDRFNDKGAFDFDALIADLKIKFPVFGLESNLNAATCDPVEMRQISGGVPDSGRDGAGRTTDGI